MLNNKLAQSKRQKVLITGGSGLVGSILCDALKKTNEYDIYILDCVNTKHSDRNITFLQADITNYDNLLKTLSNKNIDVIVHLAAALEHKSADEIKKVNCLGTENIFKVALKCGIKRIVYTSSILVMYGYRLQEPYVSAHHNKKMICPNKIPETAEPKLPPENHEKDLHHKEYAVSKLYGEELCERYSKNISSIVVRLGWVNSENNDAPNWCSHEDIYRAFSTAIEATKSTSYEIIYGISDNPNRYFSLENFKI